MKVQNEIQLAKSLIFIAIDNVDIILLRRYVTALTDMHLLHYTEAGYMLNEFVAIQFIKKWFKEVLNSFVRMSIEHGVFNFEPEMKYMFGLLKSEELVEYLIHSCPIVRELAKERFDYLNKILEIS